MYACQECGRKFKSQKAAEKAADEGCPKCGGVDIDLHNDTEKIGFECDPRPKYDIIGRPIDENGEVVDR